MSMNMTELKVSFAAEKLDALRFFMGKKQQAIEQELQEYLDKTYEKIVPAQVREYVESHIEQPSAQEQTPTDQQVSSPQQQAPEQDKEKAPAAKDRPARSPRRQKEQVVTGSSFASEAQTETEGPAEQEEGQGMTMSM